jgi:ATP-dependent Clp protease ATP-binding subunit ClpC
LQHNPKEMTDEAKALRVEMFEAQSKKYEAVRAQDFMQAATHRAEELELKQRIAQILREMPSEAPLDDADQAEYDESYEDQAEYDLPTVTEDDVAAGVSVMTKVPVSKVSQDESVRLVNLEETLHKRLIGQEEAVTAVSKAIRRCRAGLQDPKRPLASFIFCGPTGVGKTELCKALAAAYFGSEDAMIRLDMSEFMEKHTVAKLIGSPPGYVGYDDESMLTDPIRRMPYCLVVFDEVEKAHPDVFDILLQVLDDGHLTDSKGREVSFKNALLIMTSNTGAQKIQDFLNGDGAVGSSDGMSSYRRVKELVHGELGKFFRPEFLNRLDDTIVFKPLTKSEIAEVAELEFNKVFKRCAEVGVTLALTDRFKSRCVDEGYHPVYGARPLRRAIMRLLEDELAESFLTIPVVEGSHCLVDLDVNGDVVVLRSEGFTDNGRVLVLQDMLGETMRDSPRGNSDSEEEASSVPVESVPQVVEQR